MGKRLSPPRSDHRATTRRYRPGDETQILSLFHRVFGIERGLDYWHWKFEQNPLGHYIVLGVTPDDTVVAQVAGLPLLAQAEGRSVVFTCMVDLMADRAHRGRMYQRIAEAMVDTLIADGRTAMMHGNPIRSANRLPQALCGMREAYPVTRVVRPLTEPRASTGSRLARWRYEVRPVPAFGGWMDRLWERCAPRFPVVAVRDARFMNWRFTQCPHVAYRAYVLWDRWRGGPAGVTVLRLGWEGRPLAALADWLVPRDEGTQGAAILLEAVETAARVEGLRELSAWLPPASPEQRFFLTRGYRQEVTGWPLVARLFTECVSWESLVHHWYFTMADSDVF